MNDGVSEVLNFRRFFKQRSRPRFVKERFQLDSRQFEKELGKELFVPLEAGLRKCRCNDNLGKLLAMNKTVHNGTK